jgi:O-antigen/teichoic acid export membrane protein
MMASLHRSVLAVAQVTMLRSVSLALNLCTGLLTAALLGPEGRGEQAAFMLAPQVLASFATLGLHASLIYNIKADPVREREYIDITLLLTFVAGVIAVAVGWFLEPRWLANYRPATVQLARVFLLATPVMSACFTFTAVLEARTRFVAANRPGYLQSLATLIAIGVLILLKRLTPATAAAAYVCPQALVFLYLAALARYRVRPSLTVRLPLMVRLLSYGFRFYGVDVLGAASVYLDQVIIAAMLPANALGIYVVGLSVARLLNLLPTAAETVLFPTLAARPVATIADAVAAAVRVLSVVNAVAALCLGLLGPQLLMVLYGPKFAAASGPLFILLLTTVPGNAVGLFYQSYAGSGRPGIVTLIQAAGLAVSLGLMLVLVPVLGVSGAALSLLVAALVRLACVLLGMPLVLGVRVPRLIVSRSDLAWIRGR